MKSILKFLSTTIILVLLAHFSFAQKNEITITFLGNAGFHMTDGNTDIYIDFPYKSGAYGYMTYSEKEIEKIKDNSFFIFTHKHADHYNKKLVKSLNGKVYVGNKHKAKEIMENEISGFTIKPFKTKHRFSFSHYSYVIDWHGKRFFISGDTEHPEIFNIVKDIDYAFISPWIFNYAKEKDIQINTQKLVFYHLYSSDKITGSDHIIVFDKQGMNINISY